MQVVRVGSIKCSRSQNRNKTKLFPGNQCAVYFLQENAFPIKQKQQNKTRRKHAEGKKKTKNKPPKKSALKFLQF